MKDILLFIWQLPQNLLGLLVVKFTKAEKKQLQGIVYYHETKDSFGVSLGNYIILAGKFTTNDLKHEHGHQIQSLYLGPLYLILIGLPSVIGNLLNRIFWFDYYKQPWEWWADVLGGVTR